MMQLKGFSNTTSVFHSVPQSVEEKSKDDAHLYTVALKFT